MVYDAWQKNKLCFCRKHTFVNVCYDYELPFNGTKFTFRMKHYNDNNVNNKVHIDGQWSQRHKSIMWIQSKVLLEENEEKGDNDVAEKENKYKKIWCNALWCTIK